MHCKSLCVCGGGGVHVYASVCLSVCQSVTTLEATLSIRSPKLRYHRAIYHDYFDFYSQICSRDMTLILLTTASLDIFHWQKTQQYYYVNWTNSV